MIPTPCIRCGALDDHEPGCNRNTTRTKTRRTNSTRWMRLSRRLRRTVGCCEQCGTTHNLTVDHIWPVSIRPDLEYDTDWMRVWCADCNRRRGNALPTAAEIGTQQTLIRARRTRRGRPQ